MNTYLSLLSPGDFETRYDWVLHPHHVTAARLGAQQHAAGHVTLQAGCKWVRA